MSVTSIDKDFDQLKLTLVADFNATVEQLWKLWTDPRQVERWWGPPGYPATFSQYELRPGGKVSYHMTSPEGELHPGWWTIRDVEPPRRLTFTDGFADEDGEVQAAMPTIEMIVEISEHEGGARFIMTSTFPSKEAMAQLVQMGMDEGLKAAVGQIDALLDEIPA